MLVITTYDNLRKLMKFFACVLVWAFLFVITTTVTAEYDDNDRSDHKNNKK